MPTITINWRKNGDDVTYKLDERDAALVARLAERLAEDHKEKSDAL